MTTRFSIPVAVVLLATCVVALPASAQETSSTNGLQITELHNGWVIAPDVQFTQINHRSTTLAGAYGGYEMDQTLLVGAAAYWNTNRDRNFETQFGGGLVRWTFGGHQRVAVSVGSLVGFGGATLTRTYADIYGIPSSQVLGRGITGATAVRLHDDFFVAEPQANVVFRLVPWMRLDVGGGYRAVGGTRLMDHQLRGPSGSIALRFGGN